MSGFKVTPSQLESLGGAAHRACAKVRAEHQSLHAQLAPLFGSDWSGAASAQFTSLYENFELHARGLFEALDGIGALMVRAGGAYADVEQQIAATFR
jgi:WXG100 family type VII secretion target